MAKVSVILPIYNVEQYLREALDSVLNQTLTDLEIICVNDGSTDGSLDIIREYEAKDSRILVITGPNGGYGKAMNRGLDAAAGEYIGILEPDDYLLPDMMRTLYATAKQHSLDMVKADFYRFTREGGREQRTYELLDRTETRYGELLCPAEDDSCIRFQLNTWSGIYRRDFIEKFHIRHNETPGASFQDNGFYFQTFAYARRAMIVKQPFYCNRRDNPNSSVKSKEKVYCMNVEYDHIRDLLMRDRAVWERFQYMYWFKKYHNYWFTYNRIDDSYKPEYLARMRQEFKRAMELDQLRRSDFTDEEWKVIHRLINRSNGAVSMLRDLWIVKKLAPLFPASFKEAVVEVLDKAAAYLKKLMKGAKAQ